MQISNMNQIAQVLSFRPQMDKIIAANGPKAAEQALTERARQWLTTTPPPSRVSLIKELDKAAGGFFFSPGAMKGFSSKVPAQTCRVCEKAPYVFFYTSECYSSDSDAKRQYKVRVMNLETFSISSHDGVWLDNDREAARACKEAAAQADAEA